MDDRILSPRRTGLYVAIGVAVGMGVGLAGAPTLGPLATWCTAGLIALVSYFFGTVLIATTLNLVTNLAQS